MVKTKPSVHSINLKKPKSTLDKKGLKTKKQAGKIRKGRKKSQRMKREPAGVVYLSHIPHGFYEEQIEAYFGQFGKVTNVSVPRSKSRRAKGFAFIEYKYPEIAKIAADTMNNYLMFNRLLKAKYIPPEQQKPRHFRLAKFARENHRTAADKAELAVKHNRKLKNRHLKIGLEAKLAAKLLKKKNSLIKRAKKLGLDHDVLVEEGNIHSIFETKKEKNALKKIKTNKQENGEAIDSLDENLSSSESADDTLSLGSEDYLLEDIEDSLLESEEEDYEKVISKAKNAAKDILRKIPKHPKNHKPIKGSVAAAPLKALTPQQEEEIMGNNILDSSSLKKSKTLKTPLKVQSSKKEAIVESITINKNVTPKVTKNSKSLSKNVSPLIEKTPSSVKKVRASSQTSSNKKSNISQVVMEVDNNDEEIDFKTPPNVIKKFIKTEKESMKKSFKENTINQSSLTPKKPDSTKKTPKKLDSTTKTPKEGKSKISSPTSSGKKVRHRHLKHLTP